MSPRTTSPPCYFSTASATTQSHHQTIRSSPPTFRQRKSATIIPISSPVDASISPSTSPVRPIAMISSNASASSSRAESSSRSVAEYSDDTRPSIASSPPSFKSVDSPRLGRETSAPGSPPDTPQSGQHDLSGIPSHLRLERRFSNSSSAAEEGESTLLLSEDGQIKPEWYKAPIYVAGVKFSLLFVVCASVVIATFWFGMPVLEPEDKSTIKLPRSFADLQALNELFQKYKREYPYGVLACGVVTYLFIQMFTLPGSMYLSILFGAAYGIMRGLLLSCLCESAGSVLCYCLSAICAPPLLTLPFYRARVETWRIKIMGDPKSGKQVSWGDVFAFLVVLRIAPFPPHWIANFVAPHLGIGPGLFWLSCFIGIAPVTIIHVTIGSSLDQMTSAADFHLLSLRNILGLIAVVVAVLIPVGLKRVFKKDLGDLDEAEEVIESTDVNTTIIDVPPVGDQHSTRRYQAVDSGVVLAGPSQGDDSLDMTPGAGNSKGKSRRMEVIVDVDEDEEEHSRHQVFYQQQEARAAHVAYILANGKSEKSPGGSVTRYDQPSQKIKGYGTIAPVERVREEPVERDNMGAWWPFAR